MYQCKTSNAASGKMQNRMSKDKTTVLCCVKHKTVTTKRNMLTLSTAPNLRRALRNAVSVALAYSKPTLHRVCDMQDAATD